MSILTHVTITPWILGVLSLLVTFALAIVIKSWRDMKRSPYFFLRRQAEKQFQTYSLVSLALILVTAVIAAYTLNAPPPDTVWRVAPIQNQKPVSEEIQALVLASTPTAQTEAEAPVASQEVISTQNPLTFSNTISANSEELLRAALTLPSEYDRLEPRVDLRPDTSIGALSFSTTVNDRFEAVAPTTIFAEGSYTIYATFSYDDLANGMTWSWVWRHNGEVVSGGHEIWNYGQSGPGYVFYNPEEGFQPGSYTLEIWVNGELFTRSDITINNAAASANQ